MRVVPIVPQTTAKRRILLAVTIAYALLLFTLTHWPAEQLPMQGTNDKLKHFGAYFVLGGLSTLLLRSFGFTRAGLIALLACAAFGAKDEITQPWFNRHGDVWDWVADVFGAATACVLASLVSARDNKPTASRPAEAGDSTSSDPA